MGVRLAGSVKRKWYWGNGPGRTSISDILEAIRFSSSQMPLKEPMVCPLGHKFPVWRRVINHMLSYCETVAVYVLPASCFAFKFIFIPPSNAYLARKPLFEVLPYLLLEVWIIEILYPNSHSEW